MVSAVQEKNQDFREVKSGRIRQNCCREYPHDFSIHANRIVPSITMLYMPKDEVFVEPTDVEEAQSHSKENPTRGQLAGIFSSISQRKTLLYPVLSYIKGSNCLWPRKF